LVKAVKFYVVWLPTSEYTLGQHLTKLAVHFKNSFNACKRAKHYMSNVDTNVDTNVAKL